jgi:hypothetical protein
MKEASIFIKIKDEDIAKLLYFSKPKVKSKMFYEALIYYILNSDDIEDFANPVFKEEFKKYIKKIKNRYKDSLKKEEINDKRKINDEQTIKEKSKQVNKSIVKKDEKDNSENDEEFF